MIPYGKQEVSENDIQAVTEVLRSDWLTQGPLVPKFEEAVANYCGAKIAVAMSNATSALHSACLALGLGPGDLMWTSPNTFAASANAALYCGAEVDFVDIDPCTYNMSVDCLAEKLHNANLIGKLPKIVMPVHFAGQSCDMAQIYELAQRYGFRIIEDASHAIGGKYLNEFIGIGRYSDVVVFSFHPVKIITTGEGGIALTNDENIAEKLIQYRSHGIVNHKNLMVPRSESEVWNYQQINLGYNYRMTDIQAALGCSQISRLSEFVQARHRIASVYNEAFLDLPIVIPFQLPDAWSSYHLYPIRVNESMTGIAHNKLFNKLREAGIGVNLHYIPVYRHPYYESLGFKMGYCPEAEKYFQEEISLPIFPALTEVQQRYVISTLRESLSL